jgi:hypothetical protein
MSADTETAPKTSTWRGQLAQLVAIVLIVFLAKGAIAEPFYVPSGSMEPTLLIGDALLASKYPYGYSAASLKPVGIGEAEDDSGGSELAYCFLETFPGCIRHPI